MSLFLLIISLFFHTAQAQPSMSQGSENTRIFVPAAPLSGERWHRISTTYVDIHHAYKDRHIANHLAQHANTSIPQIAKTLSLGAGSAIKIYIMPDQKSFAKLQPGRAPHWADGTAWPELGLIFLRSPDIRDGRADPLTQVLDHEIAHIVLGRAFGNKPVPRWLQEGVAQLVAGEHSLDTIDTISEGVLSEELLSLHELTHRFPSDPNRAHLAYAQSLDFVIFLRQNYGAHALNHLISMMAKNHHFSTSIRSITGKSVSELDMEWRGELSGSLLWLKPIFSDTSLLSIGGLFLVLAFIRKFRHRQQEQKKFVAQNEMYELLEKELRHWQPSYLIQPPPTYKW